jgi:uncharacterized membrane protein
VVVARRLAIEQQIICGLDPRMLYGGYAALFIFNFFFFAKIACFILFPKS